jgi:hypothetical protein
MNKYCGGTKIPGIFWKQLFTPNNIINVATEDELCK